MKADQAMRIRWCTAGIIHQNCVALSSLRAETRMLKKAAGNTARRNIKDFEFELVTNSVS